MKIINKKKEMMKKKLNNKKNLFYKENSKFSLLKDKLWP